MEMRRGIWTAKMVSDDGRYVDWTYCNFTKGADGAGWIAQASHDGTLCALRPTREQAARALHRLILELEDYS